MPRQKRVPGDLGSIPDGYYTRQQAAEKVARTKDTLVRWHRSKTYVPRYYMLSGKLKVWLYDDEDVKKMRALTK